MSLSLEKSGEYSISDNLHSSELGTKEYWDSTYEREIENFKSHGDVGEVWFGEDSELRIIRWLKSSNIVKESDSIIDIGCGNGMMLIELAKKHFSNLLGVDYSEAAIKLAREIALTNDLSHIKYKVCNIIEEEVSLGSFSIVLDKGTYDAISLDPEDSQTKRLKYKTTIARLLKESGLFVITSCNWTEQELIGYFESHQKVTDDLKGTNIDVPC